MQPNDALPVSETPEVSGFIGPQERPVVAEPAGDRPFNARPFSTTLQQFRGYVRARAWRLSSGDADLRDDLEQEGHIALWKLDMVRLAAARDEAAYVRSVVSHAMYRFLRTSRRQVPYRYAVNWEEVMAQVEGRWNARGLAA